MADDTPPVTDAIQVKGTMAKAVLHYVRRVLGDEAVTATLAAAGSAEQAEALLRAGSWVTPAYVLAVGAAAELVTGDAEIGRRSGEELFRITVERGTVDFLLAAGSIGEALRFVCNAGSKVTSGRWIRLTEIGDDHAEITARYLNAEKAHRFFCGHTVGYYGSVPTAFGVDCVAAEPECMVRGDEQCVVRMRWTARLAVGADASVVEASRDRTTSMIGRFEQLHEMATDLVGAGETDTLLARIAERAGVATDATQFLLAVRTDPGGPVQVHSRGIDSDRADRLATRLLAGELHVDDRNVVADVVAGDRYYGRLAALYSAGVTATATDRRLLAAYARHAAATLESLRTLEQARRDRDTSEGLLALAHSLAEVSTTDNVARQLAAAVPSVTSCTRSRVWLSNAADGTLRLEAEAPWAATPSPEASALRLSEFPRLAFGARSDQAFMLSEEDDADAISQLMDSDDMARCAVVPIIARGTFLGLTVAGFSSADGAARQSDLMARLVGLASLAATALDNANLLDHVRNQALRDSLTGLPNRSLLESYTEQALAKQPRVGGVVSLLFIDLDRFKAVNDTYGHQAGDDLLCEVARRVSECLRPSDVLARLGGDEFVILLSETTTRGAETVAGRIIENLDRPFAIGAAEVSVSCSVGMASAPNEGSDYAALLRHADRAMYVAKQAGGGNVSHAGLEMSIVESA
jgi:diguanylate cyclase (GGDEF)-like protein